MIFKTGDEVKIEWVDFEAEGIITEFKGYNASRYEVYWVKLKNGCTFGLSDRCSRNNDMEHSFCVAYLFPILKKELKVIKKYGIVTFLESIEK